MAVDIECEVSNILGKNRKILEICNLIEMLGKTDATVLIQGESGTGKELITNTIHAHSSRANKPFIKVNCATLSESSLDRELFGYKISAFIGDSFTLKGGFELATGGTILLDEIGNLSLSAQAKLLRVLQKGEIFSVGSSIPIAVDVRVIATTNIILKKAVKQGAFREDLFYQLGTITIFLPPLRERKDDIPILIMNFIEFENYEAKRHIKGITPKALALLMEYEWPGNVRELKNAIEHAAIVENTNTIHMHSLPNHIVKASRNSAFRDREEFNLKMKRSSYERQLILRALIKADWVKSRAARLLGIDQRNLSYFIRKHHILDQDERRRVRGI